MGVVCTANFGIGLVVDGSMSALPANRYVPLTFYHVSLSLGGFSSSGML